MTDGKKDQLKRKKTLEYELRRLYRAGELTDQQIAELKEAEFPFDAPVRRTAKSVVRIDDGKRWPSCSAAEKELGITQGWMSDVCNMALRGKWVAIKNQFYCFESMYSPDMDLTEIRGLAGWIVNLETGEMFPTTTEAAKAAGTSRSVVLDHVKNKVKPQNKRFSYVRDWDGKVGRLVDLNVQMICLETDTIYHSYDEICAAIWSDGYGETRKEIVQKVGDAIRHGCPAFDMHWANRENFEERKEAYMEEKRLCARPVIELTTMREYADVHDALKFGSRYVDWKKIVAICDAKGEPTSEATRWRGERWFWKDDWKKNIKLKSGERIKDMQPVICYERGRCDYSVLELTRWYGFDYKSLLNSGKKGIVFDGLTWRLLRYDVDFEKRLKETPLICRETGKTFDTLSDLLDLLEREHECWIIANGHLPTTDPLSIHSELTYICQQYPICILVAVLYDTFGEMSVRLFFALLDMVAVLFIWYQTFPKAGNRILHCAVSCVFGAVIVYNLRSTPRALDILCLAVSWELMEKYIESRDIRFLFGFPFLGIFIANLHGALWPCAIMLPLAALLDSKLDPNARAALAVTILLTIASAMLNPYGLDVLSLPFKTIGTSDIATVAVPELKPMFSIVPVEAVILIVISVVPVIFHAKCLGFKKTVFSFERGCGQKVGPRGGPDWRFACTAGRRSSSSSWRRRTAWGRPPPRSSRGSRWARPRSGRRGTSRAATPAGAVESWRGNRHGRRPAWAPTSRSTPRRRPARSPGSTRTR